MIFAEAFCFVLPPISRMTRIIAGQARFAGRFGSVRPPTLETHSL